MVSFFDYLFNKILANSNEMDVNLVIMSFILKSFSMLDDKDINALHKKSWQTAKNKFAGLTTKMEEALNHYWKNKTSTRLFFIQHAQFNMKPRDIHTLRNYDNQPIDGATYLRLARLVEDGNSKELVRLDGINYL